MEANFAPVLGVTENAGLFRFWCQKVLPAVYDDSLSYYELLCKVVNHLNEVVKYLDTTGENVGKLYSAFIHLQDYVNSYFDNLDISEEINAKLDSMVASGELGESIINYIYKNRYKPIDMQKVIFVGDSYGVPTNSWVKRVVDRLALKDNEYYKAVQGSTGFANINSQGNNFLKLLQNCYDDISDVDRNKITHIIVCGGANDSLKTYDETVSAIHEFVLWCNNYLPTAKIMIGAIGWTSDGADMNAYNTAIEAYIFATKNNGCIYMNNVQYTLHDYSLLSNDKVHPTANGYVELGDNIYSCIMTGSCDIVKPLKETNWSSNHKLFTKLQNGMVSIVCSTRYNFGYVLPEMRENYTANGNINISMPFKTPPYIIGNTGFCYVFTQAYVTYRETEDGELINRNCHCYVKFNNGFVYISLYDTDESNNGYKTYPYLVSFNVASFSANIPACYC